MDRINKNQDKELKSREKRGQIGLEDLKPFENFNSSELLIMLSDKDPQKRTIAATLLNEKFANNINDIDTMSVTDDIGNINDFNKEYVIISLAKSFKEEKSLYSRIAMSESLASYGEDAIPCLIQLLGEIGNNQEKELPKKYFNKKSFPLPRDLAARTLVKIGETATPFLIEILNDNNSISNNFKKEQALDAIGSIAYKYNDHRAFESINNLFINIISSDDNNDYVYDNYVYDDYVYDNYVYDVVVSDDVNYSLKDIDHAFEIDNGSNGSKEFTNILIWKIVRSLSGFKNNEKALNLLIAIMESFNDINEIQWEAIRSIGQIGIVNERINYILGNFEKNVPNNIDNIKDSGSQLRLALNVSKESLGLS